MEQINNKTSKRKIFLFLGLILIGSIILSGAVSAASLANSAQPKIHHDNNNTGQSQYKGPHTNSTKWTYKTSGCIISSPSIGSDETIYIGSTDHNLYAINPNGTTKWTYTTGDNIFSSPAIGSDGTIYIGSMDHNLYAINPNGTTKWTYTTGDSIYLSSPAIGSDGTIYIGSMDHNLYAINPNGTTKWTYTTEDRIYSSPAIGNDGTIYIGGLDHNLYAINPNGTTKWTYTTGERIYSSPTIGSDGTIYIGSMDHKLYAINPNGTTKWTYDIEINADSSPAVGSDGTIYLGSVDHKLYAINPNGTTKWTYTTGDSIYSSPTIGSDGTIYIGSMDHNLYAINPNGTTKWTYTIDKNADSVPAIGSDGTLYIGSFNYMLYAISDMTISASVKGGYYNSSKTVSLTTNIPGTIYFTTDGTTPTITSQIYTNPLIINISTVLTYFEIDLDGNPSTITTQTYIIDTIPPTTKSSPKGGLYNTTKTVTLSMNEIGSIYYTLNGTTPTTSSDVYSGPITIKSTTTLKYLAVDLAGNKSPIYTQTYTIDKVAPTATVNIKSGLYNTTKTIRLSINKKGTIYYTLNGTKPSNNSTKYTGPITIKSTTTLKYLAVDLAGNKSPIYTNKYIIDKTAPKVVVTKPKNNSKGVSLTTPITIKFSENITKTSKFSKIYLKNISTGKITQTTTKLSGNTINIKMIRSRLSFDNYQIYIPSNAVKDATGNKNTKYTLNFKTSRY